MPVEAEANGFGSGTGIEKRRAGGDGTRRAADRGLIRFRLVQQFE